MTRATIAALLFLGAGLFLTATSCQQNDPADSFDLSVLYDFALPDLATRGDLAMSPDLAPPGKPLVGALIDRVGRPGINLMLTNPFGLVPSSTSDKTKDQYNVANPPAWASFAARPYIAETLAIMDGLDGTCGNQLLASTVLSANRYGTLANVLADDRLYVNANIGICMTYLAVETTTIGDCGGYHPTVNAMDTTFNLLITGSRTVSYTNGVTTDSDGGIPFNASFPYLGAPK